MEEWKIYKLGEITSKIGSGATPKGGRDSYLGGNISLIRSQNVLDFSFSKSGLAYINEMQAEKLNNVEVYEKDVLLNITGDSVARVCIVPNNVLPARVNQHVAIIRGNEKVDYRYLLYYLQYIKPQLLSLSQGGATRNALTKKMIEELEIKMPSKGTQKEIVSILYTLDTKIALNRRINDNLEQQAQALFKSWFVDFEPFKDGRFVDSEMGMIPEGWKVVQLGEIIEISKRIINPQKNPDKIFYHYSLPACDNGLIPEIQSGKDIMSNKIILQNNTILFSKLNPRIKRIWFACDVLNDSICSTEFIPYRAKNERESVYIYSIINSDSFYASVLGCVNGATGSHQRFHAEDTLGLLFPYKKDIVDKYIDLVKPVLAEIHKLRIENKTLALTRDSLLPRLMSGELKFNDLNN